MWGWAFLLHGWPGPLGRREWCSGPCGPSHPHLGQVCLADCSGRALPQLGGPPGPQRWHLVGNALDSGLLAGGRPAAPVDPVGDELCLVC